MNLEIFKHIKQDLPASIVVFFVALPLCLGIALASGAPLFSGIIAGIVGGIIVGSASGSSLGVSGPAAGLAVIVLTAINELGSWPIFLLAVVIAGLFQIIMGYAKAGIIAYFFPSSVIKGMLSGIGLLIIIKQIPHALGFDKDPEGDLAFAQFTGENTFASLFSTFEHVTPGAVLIGVLSLFILIFWEKVLAKKHKIFQLIQGPIVVIAFGIGLNFLYQKGIIGLSLSSDHIVTIPVAADFSSFLNQFTFPDFSAITNIAVWKTAFVMAIVASLETLLCVEATDKLDPDKNITPTNRELKAQGLGNLVSGFIGGLPITQVIVRSSANIAFGGKTKISGILHGVFLLISVFTVANVLNLIPLASLAAILLVVGYKLAKPILFKEMYLLGMQQFIPFVVTIIGILLTDLLTGLSLGLAIGIFFTLKESYRNSHQLEAIGNSDNINGAYRMVLAEEVSFLNKVSILNSLENIPKHSKVIIDYSNTKSIDFDVMEVLADYETNAKSKDITIENIKPFKTK